MVLRAAQARKRAAADRAAAAQTRLQAAENRERAARDRQQAACDRAQAREDRQALVEQLKLAETDALTGTRTRGAGMVDLELEIGRARRGTGVLSAVYVDVVGLKTVNDASGHAAGDAVLQRVAGAIRAQLRAYDLVVRLGGDEFLCVLSLATLPEARGRFAAVQAELAEGPDPAAIRVGFAALEPGDTAPWLVARADADLPGQRDRRGPRRTVLHADDSPR